MQQVNQEKHCNDVTEENFHKITKELNLQKNNGHIILNIEAFAG